MQSVTELREQAARCVRIAATLKGGDAAELIAMARESLARADEMDGSAKANGHDVNALLERSMAVIPPDMKPSADD